MRIPFSRPHFTGNELKYIRDVFDSIEEDGHLSGDGKYTIKVQNFIESRFGAKKALLTTSCTSALELATRLLNLSPGDEVIVPSYTFSSTVNPILMVGARPVFADIQEDTLNLDPDDIKRKITPRTKAIFPVHYAGVACAMDEIMEIAQNHDLKVVEDAAQGVNAKYKPSYLGTIGDFGCYSFHETKNYVCGEGGALLINTDDREIIERAEIIREKGTNRSKFFRGEIDKYTWVDIGSSYLMSDILAAFLYAQLEKVDEIQEKRMHVWQAYYTALEKFDGQGRFRLPVIPDYAVHNAHLFYILFRDETARNRILQIMKKNGIQALFHYLPLHLSPLALRSDWKPAELPVSQSISGRLLRLPVHTKISDDDIEYCISTLVEATNSKI